MATLASRDTTGTFSASRDEVEIVAERTRAFKKFALPDAKDGRKRFRVGGAIGPCHYRLDPFDEKAAWEEIDLALVPTPDSWADFACLTNGYQVHVWQHFRLTGQGYHYVAQFRRAGSWIRMAPVVLAWENASGERQVIAKPAPGIEPVVDNEASTCTWRDTFGKGLHFRYNLAPDHFFKTVIIDREDALPKPTIDLRGLRLTVVMALAWSRDAGPEAFAVGQRVESFDELASLDAAPDEELRDPGLYPHRRADGQAPFWVAEPKAWDSWEPGEEDGPEEGAAHRWPVATRLRRRGGQVFSALSLDAAVLREATFPVFMDTDIPEEQVGSDNDNYTIYNGTWYVVFDLYVGESGGGVQDCGVRFPTVPIPNAATIDSAVLTYTAATPRGSTSMLTNILGQDEDTATQILNIGTYNGMSWTTAVAWDNFGAWTTDVAYDSPDISVCVQDIVDRGSWASNNAMGFAWQDDQGAVNQYRISYKYGNSALKAVKFNCSYTAGGGGVTVPVFDYYYRMMRGA